MKISLLALGALATTASAGWIFPEAKPNQQRDPHHPFPPHSSQPPTHAHAAYAAQSSLTQHRPCSGHGHHPHPHGNHPKSSLGGALNSLRIWLNEHNLMNYRPFSPSRHAHHQQSPPPWLQVEMPHEPITQINWHEPVFVDDDPSHPLSPLELLAKIKEMIKADDAQGGYLPLLRSGNIKVVTSGRGYMHTRILFPGVGRKQGDPRSAITAGFVESPSGLSYVDVTAEDDDEAVRRKIDQAIQQAQDGSGPGRADQHLPAGTGILPMPPRPAPARESVWVTDDNTSEERITELNWRDPVFVDDDPAHPLSISDLRAKIITAMSSDDARGGYIPTLIKGHIRVVKTGPGYTFTREYQPGFERKPGDFRIPMTGGFASSVLRGRPTHMINVDKADDDETVARKVDAAIQAAIEDTRRGGDVPRPMGPEWMWTRMRVGITASGRTVRLPPPVPMFPGEQVNEDGPVHMADGEVRIIGSEWIQQEYPNRGGRDRGGEWRGIRTAITENGRVVRLVPPQELPAELVETMRQNAPDDDVRVYSVGGDALVVGPAHGFAQTNHGHEHQHLHPGGGLHGQGGWHHRRPQTFGGRLHRAMRNMRPAESLAMAFVLGAGLGSILHMLFMVILLVRRRIRCSRTTKEKRKAKAAKRRAKRASGGVRLEGEDAICVLRAPEAAEVEDALPGYEEDAALAAKLAQERA